MWYITIKGHTKYLTPNENVVFGRKNGDVNFPNDQSISRIHASICVIPKNELKIGEPISLCIIKDLNSKYGSYILREDNKTLISTEGCELKDGDKVQLGLQDVVLTVVYVPIVTMTSSLTNEDKTNLGKFLTNVIDGVIATRWIKYCTHLTAIKPKLTEKVIFAMAAGIPIVSPDYWNKVRVAMQKNEPIPDPTDFTPKIAESALDKDKVSLCPNVERKTLFKDKIFVFLCKQEYERYREIIRLAGGNAVVYSRSSYTVKDLCTPKVIVVQFPLDDLSESTHNVVPDYDEIWDALQAARRRMIPASEIPLSLLHCRKEKFCNPMFNMADLLRPREREPDTSEILALDTPDVRVLPNVVSNVPVQVAVRDGKIQIIPETCDDFTQGDSDFIENRANEESYTSQNSALSPTWKRTIIPEIIPEVPQEESNWNRKRSIISSDESILVPDTNELSPTRKRTIIPETIPEVPQEESNWNRKRPRISSDESILVPDTNELSPTRKRTIIPETIPETQEESNWNRKRPRISSDESILVPDTNESSAPPVFQKGKNDALIQKDRAEREMYDLLNELTASEIIPTKSVTNKVLKKKKGTFEASCERDKSEIGPEIVIIPETSKKNVEYSDGNIMPTSPIRSDDDIFRNSFETPIVVRQTTRNVSLKEKADENCNGKFTEGSNRKFAYNKTNGWIIGPRKSNSNTDNQNSMNLRKPLGKTFKKVYQKKPRPIV